jgi:hypothetical protein
MIDVADDRAGLIAQANAAQIICKGCPPAEARWLTAEGDWIHDAHTAMGHAQETGHDVWVIHTTSALYGKGARLM